MTAPGKTAPGKTNGVFTIPMGHAFADALVAGVLERWGSDPLAVSEVTILVPTRRAVRTIRDAFLRAHDGAPSLPPRMIALGEVDADELAFHGDDVGLGLGEDTLREAVAPVERQLLLARLISLVPDMAVSPAQAVALAGDLARFVDEMISERLDPARLADLVPEEHADHWRETLKFLRLVTEFWPAILAERGRLDPATRRDALLTAQARAWTAAPPTPPIVVAGVTGTIPATAELLRVVAGLPAGQVVLQGLDRDMDDESWAALGEDEAHPQATMARLLDRLGVDRLDVGDWAADWSMMPAQATTSPPIRARLVGEMARPSVTSQAWRALDPALGAGLDGITRIDADTEEEESAVVALLLREVLETPGRTAALITPDRATARRVKARLRRWNLEVDDSAGRPLGGTAVGGFLRLITRAVEQRAHPTAVLALAKHPLAALGTTAADCRAAARAVERVALRGPRPAEGFAGLREALASIPLKDFDHPEQRPPLLAWAERLEAAFLPLDDLLIHKTASLTACVRAHIEVAETLATTAEEAGSERLWRQEDGETAAALLHELVTHAECFETVTVRDYGPLLDTLMAARPVRPLYGRHPRIAILGVIEAQLSRADRVVLAGLNEGVWPPDAAADPWMSRPMRKSFGLPSPERRIGVSAHDFCQSLGAEEVFLVRAQRVEGAPKVPSRWLLRLDTVARALGRADWSAAAAARYLEWTRALDRPAAVTPIRPPAPRPPVEARPRKVSVTEVETWMRDPYALYAKKVLKLPPLDPIAAEPDAAERGQAIHATLDAFAKAHPDRLPPNAEAVLLAMGEEAFRPLLTRQPEVWAFWWPRFERIARWFVATDGARRPPARVLATETPGRAELTVGGRSFILTAKADRIDVAPDGSLTIIDYKTGTLPTEDAIDLGFSPQLPLEAAIARHGGFTGVPSAHVAAIEFWRVSGGATPGEVRAPKSASAEDLADRAWEGLIGLIEAFDDPNTPYTCRPRPDWAPAYGDYEHLARVAEWSAAAEDGGEE